MTLTPPSATLCARCRQPLEALRSTKRFCDSKCRVAHRRGTVDFASVEATIEVAPDALSLRSVGSFDDQIEARERLGSRASEPRWVDCSRYDDEGVERRYSGCELFYRPGAIAMIDRPTFARVRTEENAFLSALEGIDFELAEIMKLRP
jgi:hypothetical protein